MARYNYSVWGLPFHLESEKDPDTVAKEIMPMAVEDARAAIKANKEMMTKAAAANKETMPWTWRTWVGAAEDDDAAMETLRKLQEKAGIEPDAQWIDDPDYGKRMVLTSPSTGKPMFHNPKGLDWGDVASVPGEIGYGVGSVMGAGTGTPLGPAGVGAGAALGGQLGKQAVRFGMEQFGPTVPKKQTELERYSDIATEVGVDTAIGTALGYAGQSWAKHSAKRSQEAAKRLADFQKAGIDPGGNAGAITDSRTVKGVEAGLRQSVGGSGVMERSRQATLSGMKQYSDDVARLTGSQLDDTAKENVTRAVQKRLMEQSPAAQSKHLWEQADAAFPDETVLPLQDTAGYLAEKIRGVPQGYEKSVGKMTVPQEFRALYDDIIKNKGQMTAGALKKLRTSIGEKIGDPASRSGDANIKQLTGLYAAISRDLEKGAARVSPEALQIVQRANKAFGAAAKRQDDFIRAITANPKAAAAFDSFIGGKPNADTIRAVRTTLGKQGQQLWDDVLAVKLHEMGLPTAGNRIPGQYEFSPRTFLTNYNKMTKETRDVMFAGSRYGSLRTGLDRLVRLAGYTKGADIAQNTSNTASANQVNYVLNKLMGPGIQAGAGALAGGLEGVATTVAGAWSSAKLITNPTIVRWMVNYARVPAGTGKAATLIGNLSRQMWAPDIADDVKAFQQELLKDNLAIGFDKATKDEDEEEPSPFPPPGMPKPAFQGFR